MLLRNMLQHPDRTSCLGAATLRTKTMPNRYVMCSQLAISNLIMYRLAHEIKMAGLP